MTNNNGGFDIEHDCEKYGMLLKKSDQNRWHNKFCLLKDNYMLWYKEDEYPKMKKLKYFNSKPQGVAYLNNCIIREYMDCTQPFTFVIESCAFQRPIIFSTDSQSSRDTWIEKLTFNSNINYHNMLETQRFVRELMNTSSTMKYTAVKRKFNDAVYENETLIKLKEQLEKENEDKEKCLMELQSEFSKVKEEVDEAYKVMNNLQNSKSTLEEKNLELENELQKLDVERVKTTELMHVATRKDTEVEQKLDVERMKTTELMHVATRKDTEVEQLQKKLDEISQLKEKIDQDRNDVRMKLSEREDMSAYLELENQRIINQAQELNKLINKLKNDNLDIERKLQTETAARIEAETRLREADISLDRLHTNIVDGGTKYTDEKKQEMTTDVNKLKEYFEEVIRSQTQAVPKSPTNKTSQLPKSTNYSTSINPRSDECNEIRATCTETSSRVREQSERLREEHRKRLSVISWQE